MRVAPHVDLVLFDNVISCYPSDRPITVSYTLGEAVSTTTWDWVGLFPIEWKSLGEYLSYCWAPDTPTDCTAPRRRGIQFPSGITRVQPDNRKKYQFLYVAGGNHVVGVSSPFQISNDADLDDYNLSLLFREKIVKRSRGAKRKASKRHAAKAAKRLCDFEIINEMACPAVPKSRTRGKQKVTNVYRDSHTLVDLLSRPTYDLTNLLKVVETHPIVKEYDSQVVPYDREARQLRVYDSAWAKQTNSTGQTSSEPVPQCIQSLEYPALLSLTAGPQTFRLSLKNTSDSCPSCMIAKTLAFDFKEKETFQQKRIASLEKEVKELTDLLSERAEAKQSTADLLEWCLQVVQKDNAMLRARNEHLEALLTRERQSRLLATLGSEEDDGWTVWEPKRIVRYQKVIRKQSHVINLLRQSLKDKHSYVQQLKGDNSRLKGLATTSRETSEKFRHLASDLEARIRAVLSERAKDHSTEWRQFVRKLQQESTTQTTSEVSRMSQTRPRDFIENKQISKVIMSERQSCSSFQKGNCRIETCPTCGIQFSADADRHVIEEHMLFHKRYNL